MKTSTFILSYIITFIIIVTLCVAGEIYQQKKDAQLYNNGIHSIDGGQVDLQRHKRKIWRLLYF